MATVRGHTLLVKMGTPHRTCLDNLSIYRVTVTLNQPVLASRSLTRLKAGYTTRHAPSVSLVRSH
jgi:hypothetical protein